MGRKQGVPDAAWVPGGALLAILPNLPSRCLPLLTGTPVQVLDALGRLAATATTDATGTARLGGRAPGLYLVRVGDASARLAVE